MDKDYLLNIADNYAKEMGYKSAYYCGMFDDYYLYRMEYPYSHNGGHIGYPAYICLDNNGNVSRLNSSLDNIKAMKIDHANMDRMH